MVFVAKMFLIDHHVLSCGRGGRGGRGGRSLGLQVIQASAVNSVPTELRFMILNF